MVSFEDIISKHKCTYQYHHVSVLYSLDQFWYDHYTSHNSEIAIATDGTGLISELKIFTSVSII